MAIERRLFIAADADGNLQLGGPWALAEIKGVVQRGNAGVTETAGIVVPENAKRKALILVNLGPQTLYLGEDDTVSESDGWPVPAGGYFDDDITYGAWHGIAGGPEGCDVRWLESVLS